MKSPFFVSYIFLFIMLTFSGCQSAKKSLKRGNFDDSVLRAVDKLKDNPTHSSSAEILKQAYAAALEQHLENIKISLASSDQFIWEQRLNSYTSLNKLYRTISRCNACMTLTNAQSFENEEQDARKKAAAIRYQQGEKLLADGDRESARRAYEHFEKANVLIPGFMDVQKKLDLAYFVVGQTLIEKETETVTGKDSVITGEKIVRKIKIPVYGKVTAKLTQNRKTIHSAGLMDMQIRDFQTKRIVDQEKFQGEYDWMCEWGSSSGDERALTDAQLRLCKSQELLPPPPQQLFVEFSKPLYDRLTNKLRSFYAKY